MSACLYVCLYVSLSVCLPVCLSVCLSVCNKRILPLANKHNFFRQRRPQVKTIQIGQHKENLRWWLWTTLVTKVVTPVQFSKGFELEQKIWLHVCLSATSLLSPLLNTWLVKSNNNFIYAQRRQSFLWKLILVTELGFVYRLNNIRLKETNCACAFKQVCRSFYWRCASVLW